MRILTRVLDRRRLCLAAALTLLALTRVAARDDEPRGLDLYFIDVEGGAATLIVTPAGESILIDSGNPGDRDAGRIAAAAKDAGVTIIDHYITTHWHSDHVGGIGPLSKLLPINERYGHAIPDPLPDDIDKALMDVWKAMPGDPHFLQAGDQLKFKRLKGASDLRMRVLAANGLVEGEKPGAAPFTDCPDGTKAKPEDTSDNARSVAMLFTFGSFDLFAGGDLTWNIEHKLTCPKHIAPKVDVFLVNHHGLDLSNNPALVAALAPEVAIVNNGPRKGAEHDTMTTLLKNGNDVGVFQLHRNVRDGALNAEPARIANSEEDCKAAYIHIKVDARGEHYSVEIPSRGTQRNYDAS